MRFAGVDVGSEAHMVAVVGEDGEIATRSTAFAEDASGYQAVLGVLGPPDAVLVAMEATGHYWQNLFAFLISHDYRIVLLNPLRTRRFAEEDLLRAKTDSIDAMCIARFLQQKRPEATAVPTAVTVEIRELVALRDRLVQDFGDRTRQLHRLVDLGFPEFTRYVKTLDSQLATRILTEYPTARSYQGVRPRRLARLVYDGHHEVGSELADALCEAAGRSVGQHHGPAYQIQVRYSCEDIDLIRERLKDAEDRIRRVLADHEVGKLLVTIDGLGPNTVARIIAAVGDPARFRNAAALASYVGCVPGVKHSGKRTPLRAPLSPTGNAALRRALWMPVLVAVKHNPWLKAYYERLRQRGKPPKVALIACMRKLLGAAYSVAKHRRPFIPAVSGTPCAPAEATA
jgi:transposase